MRRIVVVLAVVLFGSIGCASLSPGKSMSSWMGSPQSSLIMSWGPPTRSTSDGAGGTILIYEYGRNTGQIPGQAVRNFDGSVSYTAPQATGYIASRMFWVDAQGMIYSYSWRGL